ncbi:hypothetical protein ACRAWF_32360 [Streptomyces sp. L7]
MRLAGTSAISGPSNPSTRRETNGSYEVIGGDPPHLTDRWQRTLSPRTRRAALAAGAIAALGVGAVLLPPVHTSRQSDPQPLHSLARERHRVALCRTRPDHRLPHHDRFLPFRGHRGQRTPVTPARHRRRLRRTHRRGPSRNRPSPCTPRRPAASPWRFRFPTVRDCP